MTTKVGTPQRFDLFVSIHDFIIFIFPQHYQVSIDEKTESRV